MAFKFNHVFHVGTGTLYASPFSLSDDCFDGSIPVCGSFNARMSDDKLARLLSEILHYSNTLVENSRGQKEYNGFQKYCLRRLYSLEVRLQKVTGQYACNAILTTLNVLPLVHITL